MRRTLLALVAVGAVVTGACSSSPNPSASPSLPVTQLTNAGQALDILKVAGEPCTGKPRLVNGVVVCGPVGSTGLTISVAYYGNAPAAKQQFQQHCSGNTWNLYRAGQNWRGALSVANRDVSPAGAKAIADALSTDAVHGCGT
jgi:hypothetical protein